MARISKNLGFTVPPRMAEEFEQVATEEGSTKSELFRRMFRLYQSYRTPLKNRAKAPDVWVERLILEAQAEERRKPLTTREFEVEMERAKRYGAKRAKTLGMTSEKELNDVLYAEDSSR
jgi:metal-responsive CopG/Arc/MetJ family transcriptional regulator